MTDIQGLDLCSGLGHSDHEHPGLGAFVFRKQEGCQHGQLSRVEGWGRFHVEFLVLEHFAHRCRRLGRFGISAAGQRALPWWRSANGIMGSLAFGAGRAVSGEGGACPYSKLWWVVRFGGGFGCCC